MDKLIEKHKKALNGHVIMANKVCGINCASDTHANITKEIAIGFQKWSQVNGWLYNSVHNDYSNAGLQLIINEEELFDIYIKSL